MLNAIGIYVGKDVLTGGGPAPLPGPVATAATSVTDTSFVANWDVYSGAVYYLLDVSLSSSFSTFILQDQPVYTNTFTVTGLIPNTTYYYRVRASTEYDTDAQAFFTRVSVAGGSLTVAEKTAVNAMVLDMKYTNIWSNIQAIYPMVGASAAACAQNLKSSSFTGNFSSGWTYASTGVTPNGTSAYMETNLSPNGNISQNDGHASIYSRSNVTAGTGIDLGTGSTGGANTDFYLSAHYSSMGAISNINGSGYGGAGSNANSLGLFLSQRTTSTNTNIYQNNNLIHTHTQVSATPTNGTVNLGRNTTSEYSSREISFMSLGASFNSTQRTSFYNIVQSFQTRLSRQVGAPIVSDPDAQAFISRVYTAGGTLSGSEPIAVNDLTTNLKINNLWSSMKAIYPMVGASAAACAQNLKSSNFTGSFTSGWTFASTGVTGNGTSAYMNTGFNPSVNLTSTSSHLSYYSRSDFSDKYSDLGANNAGVRIIMAIKTLPSNIGYYDQNNTSSGRISYNLTSINSLGLFNMNRTSSTYQSIFKNGSRLAFNTNSMTSALPNVNLYLNALNDTGTPTEYSLRECAFASMGDGLDDTQASSFYTIVQTFQTQLSRYVGTPVVSDADAQAFINRVYTAGGTLSSVEPIAVNQFTIDLKAANLWTKMQAIYPMVGASAAACAQNLKSSSFTGTFTAGWTFASTGVTGNGASTYMDTGFVPSTDFASFNNGASLYSRTNSSSAEYDYGVQASGGIGHNVYLNYPSFGARWHLQCVFADRPIYTPAGTESNGLFIGVTGAANDRRVYRNGTLRASNTAISTTNLTTLNQSIPLGCLRDTGTGYQAYSQRQYSLFALHQSLTISEVNDFTSINLTFQTRLSRNV